MNKEEIYLKLDSIFQDVFDDDTLHVEPSTSSDDIEEWDSLEHINLVIATEDAFGVKFSIEETMHMKNVGEMVDVIFSRMDA